MIDTVLYNWIYDNFGLSYDFYYGSAEGATGKYGVMFKVTDLERPETLCNFQGETGRALFQFSFWDGGNTGTKTNAHATLLIAEAFKEQFNQLRGVIGTTTQYRIENNICQGARSLGEGAQSLQVWGAFFQANIWWTEL